MLEYIRNIINHQRGIDPVIPVTVVNHLKTSKIWISLKVVFLMWLLVAIVFLHYATFRVIRMYFNSSLDIWLLGNLSVYTLSSVTLNSIVLYRRKILKTFSYVLENTIKDVRNHEKLTRKCKIYLILTTIYVISMTCMTTFMSQVKCNSKRVADWWISMVMFGSAVGHQWSETTKCVIMAIDNLLCGICLMGCCPIIALGLVVLTSAIEEMINSFLDFIKEYNKGETPLTLHIIREMRLKYYRISSTLEKVNDTCQNFVLLWTVLAVESACFSITVSLQRFGSESYETLGSSVYYIAKYGQPIVIFITVILIASAIPDKLQQCSKMLRGITLNTLGPMTDQEFASFNSHVLILSNQLQNEALGLSAGGCFLLTKNFCLSFIGLGVTYVVLLIQFQDEIQSTRKV